jgi:hypothetical protein
MALWGLIGTVGHHAAAFAGVDQLPDFEENDPIRALLRRLAAPPAPFPTPASPEFPGLYLPPQRSMERDETISKSYRANERPRAL